MHAHLNSHLVPVWVEGYGHKYTKGYILITHIYKQYISDITAHDVLLEGYTAYTPTEFVEKHFKNLHKNTPIIVYTFVFFQL